MRFTKQLARFFIKNNENSKRLVKPTETIHKHLYVIIEVK